MDIRVVEIDHSHWEWLMLFCQMAELETDQPGWKNIAATGWEENTSSLLYAFDRGRFDPPTGILYGVENQDGLIIAVSGCYHNEDFPGICMGGNRTWTLPDYRSRFLLGDYVFPLQYEWAKRHEDTEFWLSFEPFNEWLANMIIRAGQGRALRFGMKNAAFYRGFERFPGLIQIKGVDQIVIRKRIQTI